MQFLILIRGDVSYSKEGLAICREVRTLDQFVIGRLM